MMISKIESGNGDGDGNSSSGQLLRDIEAISKALYLHNAQPKCLISPSKARSRSVEKSRLSESKSSLKPRVLDGSVSLKDNKGSLWNWKKPLKALAHFGQHKFNVGFFLHIHSIEGLPPSFSDTSLYVHWKRKDELLQTRPSRVLNGIAEFDETLAHRCSVYGNRSGSLHSAKYEPEIFLIYASVVGAPGVHMGKQRVDLTRLLPLTLEELEGEKGTGRWTTSFKLMGKAKGATLNVSLGFSFIRENLVESGSNMRVSKLLNLAHNGSCVVEPRADFVRSESKGMQWRTGSIPGNLNGGCPPPFQSVEVKICDEVSPRLGLELTKSMNFLYQKLNEVNVNAPKEHRTHVQPITSDHDQEFETGKDVDDNEYDNAAVFMTEQGIEISERERLELEVHDDSAIEIINVHEIFKDDDKDLDMTAKSPSKDNIFDDSMDEMLIDGSKHEENKVPSKGSSMEDLDSMFLELFITESRKLELPLCDDELREQENYIQSKSAYKAGKVVTKSRSLDEVTESVANEFLNMLRIQCGPSGLSSAGDLESPRERLLREFEEEALVSGSFFADYYAIREHEQCGTSEFQFGDATEDFDLSLSIQNAKEEHKRTSQLLTRRRKAKLVEDLETEALMREWGLSENAFQSSPRLCSDGFGSPIELLPAEPVALPPLGEGFGPFIWTKDGGCLRSMNPSLFRNSKCVRSLIMQASRLVVLPSEMGSDIIDMLRHLASAGIEKLTLLANELMPLEDVTGKTLQQMVMDDTTGAATSYRQPTFHHSPLFDDGYSDLSSNKIKCSQVGEEVGLDFVTLEELSPLIMDRIADLSIEGLRIQSGMSEEAAPSTISPLPITKMLAFEGKGAKLGGLLNLERAAELLLSGTGDSGSEFDKLFGVSVTLEEWLRLDAGIIGKNDQFSEHMMTVLAAHHAKCVDFANGISTRGLNWDKEHGRKHGLFGNKLTVALKVQLRDPLRNYEPVGASMLALTQLERSFFWPRPKAYGMLSESNGSEEGDDLWIQNEESDPTVKEEKEEWSPCFRITEVHLSGLNSEPGKTNLWCTRTQQQSGTRWLLASGLSKSCKQPLSKSKAIVVSHPQSATKMQNHDFLWSLSSYTNDMEPGWNNSPDCVSHIRNPNITFLN